MHYNSAEANVKDLRDLRKTLRNNSTVAESMLWKVLKGCQSGGWKFRRQQSIGPYVLDFYCPELRLCVELDGSSHDYKFDYDEERTAFLLEQGITVLRYRNEQVYCNPQWVADDIISRYGVKKIQTPPLPPPLEGRGVAGVDDEREDHSQQGLRKACCRP